jgi:CRP-like cAMP-binding protein
VTALVDLERLREVGIFQGISDEELELVRASVVRVQDFAEGATVFAENSASTEMYVVDSGRVNLEIEAVPDTRLQVSSLKRNEVFGWEAIVPPFKYTSTAKAVANSSLVVLDGAQMRVLCEKHPDVCARVMEHVVRIAADQLAATRQQMFMLLHSK